MKELLLIIFLAFSNLILAGHPLKTNDALTIGKKNIQIELISEYYLQNNCASMDFPFILTVGFAGNLDFVIEFPNVTNKTSSWDMKDISAGIKYIPLSNNRLNWGITANITFPNGNWSKGFGSGFYNYNIGLIASSINENFTLHSNAGLERNKNLLDENELLWYFSLAAEYNLSEKLGIAGDIGINRSGDSSIKKFFENEAYIILGLTYSLNENIVLDAGLNKGLTKANNDIGLLFGTTISI